jgi:hypothetical protein
VFQKLAQSLFSSDRTCRIALKFNLTLLDFRDGLPSSLTQSVSPLRHLERSFGTSQRSLPISDGC